MQYKVLCHKAGAPCAPNGEKNKGLLQLGALPMQEPRAERFATRSLGEKQGPAPGLPQRGCEARKVPSAERLRPGYCGSNPGGAQLQIFLR